MPTYEYRCENGHTFEVTQRMSDEPLTVCQVCGAPVQRVFHPVAVHFKGSGFYNTDYGTRNRAREKAETEKASSKDSANSEGTSKSDKTDKSDKKPESKTASASDSKPASSS
jgi:putative FmdB family regulatory protein